VKKKKNKILVVVLVVVVIVIFASFVYSGITGKSISFDKRQSIFDKIRQRSQGVAWGVCVSNGFECGDCIDNDGDNKRDYRVSRRGKVLGDPDCSSSTDNTEASCFVECDNNSDCGANDYVGGLYCGEDGNVYRDYMTYTCYNPGKCAANCDSQVDPYLWEDCNGFGCSDGICTGLINGSVNSCSDTDFGIDVYTRGIVDGYVDDRYYSNMDFCINSTTEPETLVEYYCSDGYAHGLSVDCITNSTGLCIDGRCVSNVSEEVCGNAVCGVGENCTSCVTDCGPCTAVCGDGVCEAGETCTSCVTDCGPCASCNDTDFGIDIFEKGIVEGYYNGQYHYNVDYCIDDFALVEFYCNGSSPLYNKIEYCVTNTTNLCSDGRCINSSDINGTIPGINRTVASEEYLLGVQDLNTVEEPIEISSQTPLIESDGKIYADHGEEGSVEIKTSLDEAVEYVKQETGTEVINQVTIIEYKDLIVYEINSEKSVEILAFIPANMQVVSKINVDNGDVVDIEKPWWSFISKGA
jgi:hypothetical protein